MRLALAMGLAALMLAIASCTNKDACTVNRHDVDAISHFSDQVISHFGQERGAILDVLKDKSVRTRADLTAKIANIYFANLDKKSDRERDLEELSAYFKRVLEACARR